LSKATKYAKELSKVPAGAKVFMGPQGPLEFIHLKVTFEFSLKSQSKKFHATNHIVHLKNSMNLYERFLESELNILDNVVLLRYSEVDHTIS